MVTLLDRDIDELVFVPPERGRVLYLPGLPGGGAKIYDRSPYANIGTITGATWVWQNGLWCLSFDGSDDKIQVPDADALDSPYRTVAAWVYPVYYVSGTAIKILASKHSGYRGGLFIQNESVSAQARPFFGLTIGAGIRGVESTVNISDAWHFLVATYDGANMRLYVDGLEDAASPTAIVGTIDANADPLYIGGGVAGRFMKGKIALVCVYNRALSALEVQNHFNQEKHLFGVWQL